MSDETPFLEALTRHPEDRALRLVYADWLEERSDPRGELIRVEEQLRTLPIYCDRYRELKKRWAELRTAAEEPWLETMRYGLHGDARLSAEAYWAGLERVGWLAWVPAFEQIPLRERIEQSMHRNLQFVFLVLSVVGFDGECIMGEGGPNEPLSYHAILQDLVAGSRGQFQPVQIVDRVDWRRRTTHVSFAHNGLRYQWSRPIATDWFQGEVLDLVNRALKEAGVKERFIPLPAIDQCWSIAFVPQAVYNKAVRAGLIPTQAMVDAWPEADLAEG